jgi:hypothetical protein
VLEIDMRGSLQPADAPADGGRRRCGFFLHGGNIHILVGIPTIIYDMCF